MEIREQAFAGQPISVPVIDAHTHILGYGHLGWYQSFTSNDDIVAMMDVWESCIYGPAFTDNG